MKDLSRKLTVVNVGDRRSGASASGSGTGGSTRIITSVGSSGSVDLENLKTLVAEAMKDYFLSSVNADSAEEVINFIKGIRYKGIPITKFDRYNDIITNSDFERDVLDEAFMSSLRTRKEIAYALDRLEDIYLRKDKEDTAAEVITFEKGLKVGEFVSGASGAAIVKDMSTGQTIAEIDKLYVRMKAYFETLEIINVNTIGGKQILSPGGSVKCLGVEEYSSWEEEVEVTDDEGNVTTEIVTKDNGIPEDVYRCYYLAEQDGEKIQNRFVAGDQIYSQTFDAVEGVSHNVSNHYFWRLCTAVASSEVVYDGNTCWYADLSKTDCDSGSDAPAAGDILNQRGNRTDLDRMNFIEQSAVDTYSPNITMFHGVNSYSLDGKNYIELAVDKTSNKAIMNVYGETYIGDRNGTSFIEYTQEEGLKIKGKLSVGTTLEKKDGSTSTIEDMIASATPEGYAEFVEKVTQDLEGLQNQIDGSLDSYFFQYDPTLENYPAMEWTTDDDKAAHLNDTFTNISSGNAWRWVVDESGNYYWKYIEDTATVKALVLAGQAADTADGKRRTFVGTDNPTPPYDEGDLWSRGKDYPMLVCINSKASTGVYDVADWDYADSIAKTQEELEKLVSDTKDELNNTIGQATEAANKYTDEAKEAINGSIDELNKAKANLTDVYKKVEADEKISEAESAAIVAADLQAKASINLYDALVKAYADGDVTEDEQIKIDGAKAALDAAKAYAEQKVVDMEKEIKGSYLFQALTQVPETTIENGLILSSLIQLRDANSVVRAGINGIRSESKGDKSIANWWGGIMEDMADYYDWDGTQWVAKDGVTVPSNLPSGLIRMDGTGYLAKGKFWWDSEGKIYADPTALFLSFDVEAEAETLSATIVNIRDKQAEFEAMWTEKTDANGTKYLYTTYPLVTQGGVTMYSGTDGLDLPGIYDSIPIDGTTIYWENGVLKAVGGGGTADAVAWENITGKPTFATVATSGSYNDLSNKPTIPTIPTSLKNPYALTINNVSYDGSVAKTVNITASSLGALTEVTSSMVTSALGYTPYNSTNPNGYITSSALSGYATTSHVDSITAALQGEVDGLWARNSFDELTVGHLMADTFATTSLTADTITGGTVYGTWNGDAIANAYLVNSSVSISGQSVSLGGSISQATLRTALGLGSNAYTSTSYLPSSSYTAADVLAKLKTVDGAGSGLDADLLDGVHLTSIFAQRGNATDISSISNVGAYLVREGATNFKVDNGFFLNFDVGANTKLQFNTAYQAGVLYCRSIWYGSAYDWREIAYITSNVASATKLQTARTIWGQSFDGTGNVSGALTGVTNITASGAITASSVSATTLYQNGTALNTIIDGFVAALQGQIDSLWNRNEYSDLYAEHLMSDTIATTFLTSDTVNSVSIVGTGITAGATTANNGTYALHVTGSGYISSNLLTGGGITMYSSKKLKDIVDETGLSLKELSTIKPIRFTWKDKRDNRMHIGGIAEDVLKVLPEVIYRTSDNILTMDYGNAAFAIASSLITHTVNHEERIARLERENRALKEEVKRLKKG